MKLYLIFYAIDTIVEYSIIARGHIFHNPIRWYDALFWSWTIFLFQVEVLEAYSTPRDSRQQLNQEDNEVKCFTSPDREYSQPYTTGTFSRI